MVKLFESVDGILKCDHSNKSCWAVLSCGAVSIEKKEIYLLNVYVTVSSNVFLSDYF